MGEGYLEESYPGPQMWVRSECYLECVPPKVIGCMCIIHIISSISNIVYFVEI